MRWERAGGGELGVDLVWDCVASDGDDWLMFDGGEIRTKHPRPGPVGRMTDWAARLDAWVIGDDGEVYEWDGERGRRPAARSGCLSVEPAFPDPRNLVERDELAGADRGGRVGARSGRAAGLRNDDTRRCS